MGWTYSFRITQMGQTLYSESGRADFEEDKAPRQLLDALGRGTEVVRSLFASSIVAGSAAGVGTVLRGTFDVAAELYRD